MPSGKPESISQSKLFICRGWHKFILKLLALHSVMHLKERVKSFIEHPYVPQTSQMMLDLLCHMAQVTEQFAWLAGLVA